MKRYLLSLIFMLSFVVNGYCVPSNTMSISPSATDATTITASDENTRNSEISTKFNAHSHTDISQVGNTLNVGDATAGNKTITANNADTNKPFFRYDDTNNYWLVSSDGVAPSLVLSGQALIFEGLVDDTYETTISITEPTADRTITIPDSSGTVLFTGTTPSLNGIAFPASQSASSNVNTLDDYEEGTYQATLTCGTSGTLGVATTNDTLSYTKIGRLVYINGAITTDAASAPTGALSLNLPFPQTSLSEGSEQVSGSVVVSGGTGNVESLVLSMVGGGTTSILIVEQVGTGTTTANDVSNHFDSSTDVTFSFYYLVE